MTARRDPDLADSDREARIGQMAAALVAHLGSGASAFAARQAGLAEGDIRVTWDLIVTRLGSDDSDGCSGASAP